MLKKLLAVCCYILSIILICIGSQIVGNINSMKVYSAIATNVSTRVHIIKHYEPTAPSNNYYTEKENFDNKESEIQTMTEEKVTKKIETKDKQDVLVDCRKPDKKYKGKKLEITGRNRDYLERLVFSEAGSQGFKGACLVAQALRDTMFYEDEFSVLKIKQKYKYSGTLNCKPSETAKEAVKYIFDEGGVAVQHRLMFYYAPKRCKGVFHETQHYVITYKDHKFFDLR